MLNYQLKAIRAERVLSLEKEVRRLNSRLTLLMRKGTKPKVEPAPTPIKRRLLTETELRELHNRASLKGEHRMLLHQIYVPADETKTMKIQQRGLRRISSYQGFNDLSAGHWVYVAPYWYIWAEKGSSTPISDWDARQAAGKPDVRAAGDDRAAWASATQDGQDEWLMLEYDRWVTPSEIHVHETYNPGALTRVTAFDLRGREIEIWKGNDPLQGKAIGVAKIQWKGNFKTNRVKLYLASRTVRGWNEIGAVGLKVKKEMLWARSAFASTNYGQSTRQPGPDRRISQLEAQVRALKEKIRKAERRSDK